MSQGTSARSGFVTSTLLVWSARTVSPIIRMLLAVAVSRQLGVAGLGEYQIMITYPAVFEMISALGLWPLLIRNVARNPHEAFRYLLHGSALSLTVGLLLLPPLALCSTGYSPVVRLGIVLLGISLLPSAQIVVSEAILIATGKPQAIAMLLVVENLLLVAASTSLLSVGYGLIAVAAAILAFRVLTAFVALGLALRACGPERSWRLERTFALSLLREAPVFLLSSFTWALYSRLDVLVLSRAVSVEEVGYYAAAQRIVLMCQELPQSLMVVMFPILAAAYKRDALEFRHLMARIAKYMIMIAVPLVVGATVVGAPLLGYLFGARFETAAPILSCLMLSLLFFGMTKLLGSGLIATDNQSADLAINVVVLALTFGMLLTFVPRYGALGAAYAMLGSVLAAVVLRAGYFWNRITLVSVEPRALATVGASAAMWAFLVGCRGLPLPLQICAGGLVYALGLVILGAFTRAELENMPILGPLMRHAWLRMFNSDEVKDAWRRET